MKPEDIVIKLRQIEVLHGQGLSMADAVRQIGILQHTFYRWRKQYGGMNRAQLSRLAAEHGEETTVMIDATHLKAHRTASSLSVKKGRVGV